MKISVKELLARTDSKNTSGIFTFENAPQIRILNRRGVEAKSYDDLEELLLNDDEQRFVDKTWQETLAKNPKFYDGYVTAVVDIIYNAGENSLEFVMDKTRYSTSSALYKDGYPNPQRAREFLSFGLGLMSKITVSPDDSFLMLQRSQTVYSEKGAYSIPGGALEFKKTPEGEIQKDDIATGLKSAALHEVEEEVLPEQYLRDKEFLKPENAFEDLFNISLGSIDWNRNPTNGKIGLNCTFQVIPEKPLTRGEIMEAFQQAKDKDESNGAFFFVDPGAGVDARGDSKFYAAPKDMIEATLDATASTHRLQLSGTAAIASGIFERMKEDYAKGLYPGAAPRMDGVAAQFTNMPGFSIFELSKMLQNWVERPLPKPEIKSTQSKALRQEEKGLEKN